MNEKVSINEDTPEELTRAEKLINDAKVKEAHELLNNFERKEGLTLHDKVSSHLLKIDLLFQQGRYKEVLTLAEETYDMSVGLGKNLQSIDCFIFMADSLVWFEKPDKAFDILIQGEELLKNLPKVLSSEYMKREASIAKIKGWYYFRKLDIDLTMKHFMRSLELGEQIDFKKLISLTLTALGDAIAKYEGDMDLAFEYAKKGVATAKESKNKFTIAQCLLRLGELYRFTGDWERGLKIYNECLSIYEELDNKERMSVIFYNMAETYRDFTDDYDRASECVEASIAIYTPDINYIWAGGIFYIAITIALKRGDHKRAKQYLQHLEQMNNQVKRKGIESFYRLSKALILKSSFRFRDMAEAEKILRQIINEEIFDFQESILPLINLCDLLLTEFRVTNNLDIINELEPLIAQLLHVAEKTQSHWIQAETYILQAKLALLSFDVKKSRRFLTQAQHIAERFGLKLLAIRISNEHDKFLKQLSMWENLEESSVSLKERMEFARINEEMDNIIRKRALKVPKLSDEEPVLLLIVSKGGKPIFSQSFEDDQSFEDYLFGGFFTAINSFINEKFSVGLDRASFGEHTLLMHSVSPFYMCYVFKGQSYLAQQRIKYFIDKIQDNEDIWQKFKKFYRLNKEILLKDIPSLEPLINEIFVDKTIPLN